MRREALSLLLLLFIACMLLSSACGAAEDTSAELKPYIESVEQAKEGMTLWEMIKTGGLVMVVLGVISVIMIAITIYNFLTLKVANLTPRDFSDELVQKLEEGKELAVRGMCGPQKSIIANIVMAGLDKKHKGHALAREAMENCERREISDLWQNISYLADIAVVAPLIGLLGTVLGMIQAFNVIAFQAAVVKPILLAGGVSKAMVTTAGGLIVAIPAMLFYAYFRGKVQSIANIVETYSTDIIKIIEGS
ncbi:MotA/TolQ/ExbB proton channel family protein [Candidatus Omnitrophota bacterium]